MNSEAVSKRALDIPKSLILLIVVGVAFIGLRGWRAVSESRAEAAARPFFALDAWTKDLLAHRARVGDYPRTLAELEPAWRTRKPPRRVEPGGWVRMRNVDHWYHKVMRGKATLWCVPVGPARAEGKTFFCIFDETQVRIWKGPPLSVADANVTAVAAPSFAQLAALGLIEQPPVPLVAPRRAAASP